MLKLYNTLTKEKEIFEPIDKKNNLVRMYSCGLTVYNYAHIGNMRTYIFMDTLRKVLKYNGYKLLHVMNITDVGHLTSDADEGEDKMAKSAREQNLSVYEIAQKYTEAYQKDFKKLNIEDTEILAKATDHIKDMEEYVEKIIENGYAYKTSKGVYFDTSKLKNYGRMLSNNNLEDLKAGARIEVDKEKKNPQDFALWIKAPKEHIMKWDSFMGLCYPGWHIECSAMSRKYLGDVFDIHTGGVDHIPIHHENEIAQAIGATGKVLAKIWMHVEFLQINGGKMSKSLKNVYTITDLENNGIEPLAYRYFTFSANYRTKLNFTWDAIKSSQIALNRLREATKQHRNGNGIADEQKINMYIEKFNSAINDDINMPLAMAVVWDVAREQVKSKKYFDLLMKFDYILSLDLDKNNVNDDEYPQEIKDLLEERKNARLNKDYSKSDELRNKIYSLGYEVKDTREGQIIKKI